MSLKIVLILANSVDPDEMLSYYGISSGSSLCGKVPVTPVFRMDLN